MDTESATGRWALSGRGGRLLGMEAVGVETSRWHLPPPATRLLFLMTAAALVAAARAPAADAASAASDASATVITNTTIAKLTDLEFGGLTPGSSAGTVTVTTSGTRSATGGITLLLSPAYGAASFTVTKGGGGDSFSVSEPTSATTVTIAHGASTMTVTGCTQSPANGPVSGSSLALTIGGTLNVAANQQPGSYSGSFSVTVTWE